MENKTFIFFHGWGLSPLSYKRFLNELSKQGKVISPRINFKNYQETLNQTGNSLKNRVTIVAHSAGAILATELENKFPEKIEKVILVCPLGFSAKNFNRNLVNWFRHFSSFVTMSPFLASLIMLDFFKTSLMHPILSFSQVSKLLRINALANIKNRNKYLVIFAKNDQLISAPLNSSVKFKVVNGDHYFFLRKPELLMERI